MPSHLSLGREHVDQYTFGELKMSMYAVPTLGMLSNALRTRYLCSVLLVGLSSICSAQNALPPVSFPPENPFSVEKSTLGKILFWDAQLSSDNTISCGTCHIPSSGGADPRVANNPGFDGLFGTNDDVLGSPGIALTNSNDDYLKSVLYDLLPQVTTRVAQPAVMSMFADELFWDGRASSQFVDPKTGQVIIESGGALESQALGPVVSDVEMAHMDRNWDQVVQKLEHARPLALASDLPADLASIIGTGATYPALFENAFGDDQISASRIAMAIATYERTLHPNQSPFDNFARGDTSALTQQEQNGFNAFVVSQCAACHAGSQFTGNGFRNIGLRPIIEDAGRFGVTGNQIDQGRFKVPSLRNVALRNRFMHNGQLSSIEEVFDFYARRNGQVSFPNNRDPLLNAPIAFPPNVQNAIIAFLTNGLTDPRVANEQFPFDRPTLLTEQLTENPAVISTGSSGSGGFIPQILTTSPPNIGNADFKIGIDQALAGAQAWVIISDQPPVEGQLNQDQLLGPIVLEGTGVGTGFGTMHYPIPDILSTDGQIKYMQWIVNDPNALNGQSFSPVAQLTLFCSMHSTCINFCPADINGDGDANFFDVSVFLSAFSSGDLIADFNTDGSLDFFDVSAFLVAFSSECN